MKPGEEDILFLNRRGSRLSRVMIFLMIKELVKQAGAQPKATVDLVNRYRDCAGRLASVYREHIRTEDEILTRLSKRSLTDSDLAAISAEMKARRAQ